MTEGDRRGMTARDRRSFYLAGAGMAALCGLACCVAACLPASAQALKRVPPAACVPEAGDYTHMWWADGFRGRSQDGRWLRCVQSGRYAMALDVEKMQVAHLGALPRTLTYEQAAVADNAILAGLPPAELDLSLTVDGKRYRCVRGGQAGQHSGPRLIESGRFLQRADVTDLVFADEAGARLAVDARLETVAWPDRLTLLLDASPTLKELKAGPSFGRVGGGIYFDGKSHLEVPHAPELEPEHLTLALWVYVPEGDPATRAYPWLVCKNGNEWAQGNYGFWLINGAPHACLNIGGGRENVHMVSTSQSRGRPRGNEALTRERWHHLALTYDGDALRLYVDGKERDSEVIGKKRIPGAGGLALGRRQDGSGDGYHFRGVLNQVRLYRRALSAEEMAALVASPEKAGPGPDLVCEWAMDPHGTAAAQRPGQEWADASLEIRLRAGGRVLTDRVAVAPGEKWTCGQRKSVAVSLLPGAQEAPAAPGVRVSAVTIPESQPQPVAYDPRRDWFRVDLDGVQARGEHNDAIERVKLTVANPDAEERVVRLFFDKNASGMKVKGMAVPTGLTPMLRDEEGHPLGIPVQISKNWHRQAGREILYQGAWLHGFSLLRLPPRSETVLEFTLTYAHWGGVAAASHAQLCLIGWGSNQLWDQAAIGCWGESICFEPDQAQAEATVLDVRPLMVHGMNRDEPVRWSWTNNVGGGDFFRIFDAKGNRQYPARMKTAYRRQGPNLTEVTYAGRSAGGKIEHQATVSLYRTNDLTRGIYRLRMVVKEPVDFQRMVFFQVGSDTYNYTGEQKMALGSEQGLTREWETQWGGSTYRTAPMECTGRVPWISLHEAASRDRSKAGAWANRGIIIRRWNARLGGKPAAPWAAEYGVKARGADTSVVDILPPPDVKRLLPGDTVEAVFEHVILPQLARDYYGPNESLRAALAKGENTWRLVAREATGNDLGVRASRGVVEAAYPVRIRATGDRAEFEITGGLGHVPVTLAGLSGYRRPVLEMQEGAGPWRAVDQSVHGNDFWQTDHDAATGTWEITYTLPLDTPGDARQTRRFRFHLQR